MIKRRLRTGFTADYIAEIIAQYPELVRLLYAKFADIHVKPQERSFDYVPPAPPVEMLSDAQLKDLISRTVSNDYELMVMEAFTVFNSVVLKTNYYTPTKMALSFRLDPKFLLELKLEYPQPLYGMFLVISSEFRGFHLRFRDIARGGIRIVKSRNREAYSINVRSMFDENYGLANTQQSKNKDIPEGGSKGVILLEAGEQDKGSVAFEKYIDSIIDLLIPLENPIVDLYGKPEILFMGPDENTADLVDWATEHAKKRGAPWWKSFFTGKSPRLGGIPHDTYGMTTLSVREYVTGIYRKLNLDPSKVRKMQTGGPDGDLGSNEILLSNEKYVSIVDGSGVLVDPNGIDHKELIRLAKERCMISEFDVSKLSKQGYRVLVDETNVSIPTGEVIGNGTTFRNTFHLRNMGTGSNVSDDPHSEAVDMFVPCGGRPESINLSSANKLIKDGKCIIPYIIEGANLFITQDAKLRLEAAGCIIYKDSSANKGGVTSSSLEVLASLSFDDQGFIENMCVGQNGMPEFYKAYVKEVQGIIKQNARLEFEAVWREHEETGISRSLLSDALSVTITRLNEELQNTSGLWNNPILRQAVLKDALPKLLLEKIGLDLIIQRVGPAKISPKVPSDVLYRFLITTSDPSSAAILHPDLCTSSEVTQANSHSSICKCPTILYLSDRVNTHVPRSMSKKMAAVAPKHASPQRSIAMPNSQMGVVDLRKRGRRYTFVAAPAAQEDRDRRRRNDDWSEERADHRVPGEMMTIFDIKDSSKGQIYILCRAAGAGFRQRLSSQW